MKSWENNMDCFGNSGPATTDHIYPLGKGGLDKSINWQKLTKASNNAKGDKLTGDINGIEFRVLKQTSKGKGTYGKMRIKEGSVWVDVEPVR